MAFLLSAAPLLRACPSSNRSSNICSSSGRTVAALAAAAPPPPSRRHRRHSCRHAPAPPAALKGVQDFDGGFVLEEQKQEILFELLYSDLFCQQVVRDCQLPEGTAVAFSGIVFQPVPWSPATKKGMPREIEEQYAGKPEQYTLINVPPVFMFQAKIFQPPRLCAVYERLAPGAAAGRGTSSGDAAAAELLME